MKSVLVAFFSLVSFYAFSQNGIIRGILIDESNGETIIGANVVIDGTSTGTSTDLDGSFSLEVAPGIYNLTISYISFENMLVKEVEVKAGQVTPLGTLAMLEGGLNLEEVVISAKAIQTTEVALLAIKKKSAVMLDGISAAKIGLIGDATAVEAAKRVTGVSIEDGKYVYVRGLGDRYAKTTLNGMDIPGLDPDRNSLQMDIFPTNLIDNIVVSKNFTADMPADFTGGLLNVQTKDFPEEKIVNASFSMSYNPSMHLNPNYLTYDGGNTDFLGFDDGSRALPARARSTNIPTPISGASTEEVTQFVQSFNPELAAKRATSPIDISAGFSMGDQFLLKKTTKSGEQRKLGYVFSLGYRSDYKYYDDVTYAEYQRFIDPDLYAMRYATIQTGEIGENNVLIGALGGLAYKTNLSKVRFTVMHLQNGENRAAKFNIDNDPEAVGQSGYFASSDNLEYNQRSLTNLLFDGTHVLKNSGWELKWGVSPTLSLSDDPDIRKTAFTETNVNTFFSAGAGGNPTRIWRSLSEFSAVAKVDLTRKYSFKSQDAKLKFGMSQTFKQRDYEILFFDVQFFGGQQWDNPDPATVLNPENIFPNKPNSIYYQSGNNDPNPNAYMSNVQNTGLYASNELRISPRLNTILGVRAEYFVQRHTGLDQRYASGDTENGRNLDNEKVLEALDLFPSVNLIYSVTEEQNLRVAYSKTIARPSFKELSFAQIIDPITNRIFNGSLFPYSDWDGNLTETRIDNVDLRWELFLPAGQIFSVSGFYKRFDDPIELVRIPEQQTSTEFQPRNVGDGQVFGAELEIRKDLGFISNSLRHFNLNGNFTLVKSTIDMTDTEFNSRKSYEKTGETIKNTRQMAGQAPYVVNAGLGYSNSAVGIEAGIFYNVKGRTLTIVGAGLFPDVYFEPFQSLNFSFNKKLGSEGRTVLSVKASNLLNDRVESFYQSFQAEPEIFSSLNPGRAFSLGLSHNF